MSYLGSPPQFAQFPSKFFDGDGSAMTVTLDYAPPNLAALLVFIDGVRQNTNAYTLSGTSLTFTGAAAALARAKSSSRKRYMPADPLRSSIRSSRKYV